MDSGYELSTISGNIYNKALSFRRIWVITIAITVSDLSVWPMNHDFTVLIFSDASCNFLSFSLSWTYSSHSRISGSSNSPLATMRYNMLILPQTIFLHCLYLGTEAAYATWFSNSPWTLYRHQTVPLHFLMLQRGRR